MKRVCNCPEEDATKTLLAWGSRWPSCCCCGGPLPKRKYSREEIRQGIYFYARKATCKQSLRVQGDRA